MTMWKKLNGEKWKKRFLWTGNVLRQRSEAAKEAVHDCHVREVIKKENGFLEEMD